MLLKAIKTLKIVISNSLTIRQRALVDLQRTDVITSCSSETEESDHAGLQMMGHAKPMVRVFGLGKLSMKLNKYTSNKRLTGMDKSLIRGFYVKNKNLLENQSDPEDICKVRI